MKTGGGGGNHKVSNSNQHHHNKNGFLPYSLKFISSCLKTASSGVRSAGASVAASISGDAPEQHRDQVLWASFDQLEFGSASPRHVLLLGYSNGFQVLDVEDASNVSELVSKRDDPVLFLRMQPFPERSKENEGFITSHPILIVVACDETSSAFIHGGGRDGSARDGSDEPHGGNLHVSPTTVRFYSLRSHTYAHVLRFRSAVYMVRCSPRVVAVGLATQIYCFDAHTLENKFSVLTYPVSQLGGQGLVGGNIGYGPMAVGPRWLAYASNNPLQSSTGRLSPQSLTPRVSPSTSPSGGSLVARYAMESSKQLAAGLINLGDVGYKTLSKYCQDLRPDGSSSPVSSNVGWKVGRGSPQSAEADIAGMVVVKDLTTRAVISQFRAHTSPISALCFDPSGTLLVTASIHGNNINIFRIMPSCSKNGSGIQNCDWSSSHVHLYKLHRGMTSAVIQDICFSAYSQWVAIVSSRGTCHIFVLSPFGGENVLQIQNSHVDGPIILPALSLPWWSTADFMVNQQSFSAPPPATVTMSVVSRIKNGYSGWLNTVTNAASSVAGKASIPSGALAAVFHNSLPHDSRSHQKANVLEHLLVYNPSGHVVQYKLLPYIGGEFGENTTRTGPGSVLQVQEDELRVKVEAVQAWDVCRRTDWPEREECLSGVSVVEQEVADMIMDMSDCEDDVTHAEQAKPQDRYHLYLSNAEVQISSGRIPVWQSPKISFYTLALVGTNVHNYDGKYSGGEVKIEQIPAQEVEISRRDLLPVFDHFHRIQSHWNHRGSDEEKLSFSTSSSNEGGQKFLEHKVISHSKLVSPSLIDEGDDESSRDSYPSDVRSGNDHTGEERGTILTSSSRSHHDFSREGHSVDYIPPNVGVRPVDDDSGDNLSLLTSGPKCADISTANSIKYSDSNLTSEVSNTSSNRSDLSMNTMDEGTTNHSPDFEQFFHEGYCKASPVSTGHESTAGVTDVDSNNSPCNRDKSEEECDNEDILGGIFAFSEEG